MTHRDDHDSDTRTQGRRARWARLGPAAVLLGAVFLAACDDDPTSPSDLMGGEWRLESMQPAGSSTVVPQDPARYTIEFHADGRVEVMADCNGCGGSYSLDDDSLSVSALTCTLIACPAPTLGQQFAQLLEGTASIDLDDDRLTITSPEGMLRFRR